AKIVFDAGWPITMVGLDVGNRTLFTEKHFAQLEKTRGPANDFALALMRFLLDLSREWGSSGTQMYDPLAVGVAIDRTLVKTQKMRVDIETQGELTRGETVANRQNSVERNVTHGDRLWIEGIDRVRPNAEVCLEVDAERFLQTLVSRLAGH